MAGGAIFHLDVKTISRSQGRSAVAAAAYRAGTKLLDARTGLVHDFRKKQGVVETFIAAPDGCDWITDRNALWDAAEAAEKRKNSTVAREWMVALPDALDATQRADLARTLATELVTRFGIAVDVAIHAPSGDGDQRNHHAHLLTTTREAGPDGFGAKTRILDAAKTGGIEIANMREWWAGMVNDALAAAESTARIDHRRKSVIAAEARAEADALDQHAKDISALNSWPATFGELFAGFRSAARAVWHGGRPAVTANAGDVEEMRDRAKGLHKKANKLTAHPPAKHDGPQLTTYKRAMKDIWAQEDRDRAARIAAEEEKKRDREAKEAAKAEELRKQQEATQRAEQDAARKEQLENERREGELALAENFAPLAAPLIKLARVDREFAKEITRRGISLAQSDHSAAYDPNWSRCDETGKTVYMLISDIAEARKAEMREAQRAQNVERQKIYDEQQREKEKQRLLHKPEPATGPEEQPKPQTPPKPSGPSGPSF